LDRFWSPVSSQKSVELSCLVFGPENICFITCLDFEPEGLSLGLFL